MKTLPDFIAAARSGSRAMTYSSSGLGSMGHLVAETFAQQARIRVEHVPYKGASQGLMDLVGGHIAFACQTLSSTAAQLRSGGLIGLAHTASERLPAYSDMPTFAELGFPGLVSTTWFSLSGPARLPAAMVEKVNREVVRALAKPELLARLAQDGMVTQPMDSSAFQAFVASETARWKPVAERMGIQR
jgi:tripartite-type tricarboxylate transporter receptor subunit TctC